MPRQLGASLQSERGSLPEKRESDMSLKFTAGDLTIHRLIEEETTYEEWRTLATTRPCG